VVSFDEVVQRAQQQDGVSPAVRALQAPSVSGDTSVEGDPRKFGRLPRLLKVQWNGIDEAHTVSLLRQPDRVGTRATAHVKNGRRRCGEVALDEFLCTEEFQPAAWALKSAGLTARGIVLKHQVVHVTL
jgi:hypothetical protein